MPRLINALLVAAFLAVLPAPTHAADTSWFSNVSAVDQTFYPRVPDDYKDRTEIRWDTADTDFEACWASVYAPDGRLLIDESTATNWQTEFLYSCEEGAHNWLSWNGRDKNGRVVPVGRYVIKVKYYQSYDFAAGSREEDVVHTLTRSVNVTTGIKWFQRRLTFPGSSFDSDGARGNCEVLKYSEDAILDCRGGRYARVMYDVYVQYDLAIKNFRWSVSGERGCCSPGTVARTADRDRHDLKIRVQVTGWRQYEIDRVGVSWMAKDRI